MPPPRPKAREPGPSEAEARPLHPPQNQEPTLGLLADRAFASSASSASSALHAHQRCKPGEPDGVGLGFDHGPEVLAHPGTRRGSPCPCGTTPAIWASRSETVKALQPATSGGRRRARRSGTTPRCRGRVRRTSACPSSSGSCRSRPHQPGSRPCGSRPGRRRRRSCASGSCGARISARRTEHERADPEHAGDGGHRHPGDVHELDSQTPRAEGATCHIAEQDQ